MKSTSRHLRAAKKVISRVQKKRPDLLAAVLFGSVARGTEVPESDVNLLLLTRRLSFSKKAIRVDGVRVRIEFRDYLYVMNEVFNRKSRIYLSQILPGEVLYCSDKFMKNLLSYAKQYFKDGVGAPSEMSVVLKRFMYDNVYNEIRRYEDDSLQRAHLLEWTFSRLLSDYFFLNGKISPQPIDILDELEKADKGIHEKVLAFIRADKLDLRQAKLFDLMDAILAPFGGRLTDEYRLTIRKTQPDIWIDG